MSGKTPPEITLELAGGGLVIRAPEAVYRLKVSDLVQVGPAAGGAPPALTTGGGESSPQIPPVDGQAPVILPDVPPAQEMGSSADDEFYQELSHDMYREVGRLARRLSLSIRDVKLSEFEPADLESAGDQLEAVKDQLENVVEMTEQASMRIMDLGEDIQTAINKARELMEKMKTVEAGLDDMDWDEGGADQARGELEQLLASTAEFLGQVKDNNLSELAGRAETLRGELESMESPESAAPAPAPPAAESVPAGYQFPLELVFQTVYELCTNETVKKHLKAMWDAGAKAFDQNKMETALNLLAADGPDEDNFLNLDVKGVLKALYDVTDADRFKSVLKKMGSTADQIFLDPMVPLEAIPAEGGGEAAQAPAPEPEPVAASPAIPPEVVAKLGKLAQDMLQAGESLAPPLWPENWREILEQATAQQGGGGDHNQMQPELRAELEETVDSISNSVNGIIEALSFQDLSGQAIFKIVRLLTDFQVQLLATLVSFGAKIKSKETDSEITTDQSERMAQEEVDKVLSSLGVSEDGEGLPQKLDQDSLDQWLDGMGF